MAKSKEPRSKSSKRRVLDKTSFPYPDFVKSDPVLQLIFDRIRTGQHCRVSEFMHFIAPVVKGFEAPVADFLHGRLCLSQSTQDRDY